MVAKAVKGRPVKLQWTREEDWSVGTTYRAMGAARICAGLGADGYPIAMDLRAAADRSAAAPERGLVPGYFAPNLRVSNHFADFHVTCSTRRATGSPSNVFFVESFVEEMAHAAGCSCPGGKLYFLRFVARSQNSPHSGPASHPPACRSALPAMLRQSRGCEKISA
jgi:hypothetical protein